MPREKVPCGNPLFLSWVQGGFYDPLYFIKVPSMEGWADVEVELRDKAREKGTKAAETYTKACNSLERCPVSYPRPRDLICLTGIGVKTVGILEFKWKKHCEENGLSVPGSPEGEQAIHVLAWLMK